LKTPRQGPRPAPPRGPSRHPGAADGRNHGGLGTGRESPAVFLRETQTRAEERRRLPPGLVFAEVLAMEELDLAHRAHAHKGDRDFSEPFMVEANGDIDGALVIAIRH